MQNMQFQQEEQPVPGMNQGESAAAQPQQAQQDEALTTVDYKKVFQPLFPIAYQNKDLAQFSYYLYKTDLVREYKQSDDEWIALQQRVNFCNCGRLTTGTKAMNGSRLTQLYVADIFTDSYTTMWKRKSGLPDNLMNECQYCKGKGNTLYPVCPYQLTYIFQKAAEAYQIDPEVIYNDILGDEKIPFRGTEIKKFSADIPEAAWQGINAKSAHAAYALLAGRFIAPQGRENGLLRYSYVPLCRKDNKENLVYQVTEFWKTGSGVWGVIDPNDRTSFLYSKTEGCRQCEFEQCPHKLAAYFMHLASQYRVNPIDLAYHAARNSTYAGIDVGQNFQFARYLENVRKAPMREESKAEFIKMIHFIVGRSKNFNIPFLPFNLAITAPDKNNAIEIADDFRNALWYFDYYQRGRDATESIDLYMSSTSVHELLEQYENCAAATTICLHDVDLLCDNKDFMAACHKLLKIMEDRRGSVMSIIIGEKVGVQAFFSAYPEFRTKIFTKTLEMFDMDDQTVLEHLADKLAETFNVPDDVMQRLEQYVRVVYPSSALRSMEFVNDLYEKLLFNHYNHDVTAGNVLAVADIPYIKPPRSEQEIFEEINKLTGLDNVKKELRDVNDLVKFNIKMGASNKNAVNLHMVFSGNPGTGKTTVARLTAEILHSIGFIQENKLVVCSAKDLIGEYVGQTTPKTAQKCEEAYNGVLFIDEAYQLNPYTSGRADTFKEECIAELIQQMENNRDKLVVIFAGYTNEMEDFLNRANTGLRSRIGKTIVFPDYSSEELLDIFQKIVSRAGMELGEGAAEKALSIFFAAKQDAQRFGNARYARNLFERSIMQHAAITANLDEQDPALRILRSDEITPPGR